MKSNSNFDPEIIDSHCHLDYLAQYQNVSDVVARARAVGVSGMVTICTKIREFDEVLKISEQFDNVWCSVGLHPHEVDKENEVSTEHLIDLSKHPKVIGIGETGLDYYYENSSPTAQKRSFRAHIAAARETGLPLIVHTRDADDETSQILNEEMSKGKFPGLIHCYSSSKQLAENAINLGFFISLAGIITFKNAGSLREIVKELPLDRLLVETDSPYLAPVPKRGNRNEPAYIIHTVKALAELRNMSINEVASATNDNFYRLFSRLNGKRE